MNTEKIKSHIDGLSDEAKIDIAKGRWDEVMTDALYAACGASTVEDMEEARWAAENLCAANQ